VFLIAGEASGDALGAALIPALEAQAPGPVRFVGVGGPQMAAAGMEVLLRAEDLSVMGLLEILPEIPRLWKIMKGLKGEILRRRPAVLVTIDFPDFNILLGASLRKAKPRIPHIHYVAPTVWAWRPGRARYISRFLDGIACLLPFEPPYFEEHGLPATFVGHPAFSAPAASGPAFRAAHTIPEGPQVLGLLFGSRSGEVRRCGRALVEAAVFLREQISDLHILAPTLPQVEYEVLSCLAEAGLDATVTADPAARWGSFAAMDAAVAVSGTVGLELAAAGVPHLVAYKASPLTAFIARRLARVQHVHLANLILGRAVVPELLQKDCEGEAIAKAAGPLLTDPAAREAPVSYTHL